MSESKYLVEKTPDVVKITFEMPGFIHVQEFQPNTTEEELEKEIAKFTDSQVS